MNHINQEKKKKENISEAKNEKHEIHNIKSNKKEISSEDKLRLKKFHEFNENFVLPFMEKVKINSKYGPITIKEYLKRYFNDLPEEKKREYLERYKDEGFKKLMSS